MNLHYRIRCAAAALTVVLGLAGPAFAAQSTDLVPIKAQLAAQHQANVQRLKDCT